MQIETALQPIALMWGEPGYNEETEVPMWPFPAEDLMKEKLAGYYYDESDDDADSNDSSGGNGDKKGDSGSCFIRSIIKY